MSSSSNIVSQNIELKPRITVIGVGGAGGNAVNNMIDAKLEGVDFIVANTDAQALAQSLAAVRLQLGLNITQGLGAGSRPDVGRAAAEESMDEAIAKIKGSNMVFITAGMGGGTGTGAAPVLARAAREQGILTVGVVTKPFNFEGANRMRLAEKGIEELQQYVDTLIIIPNQNLFRLANEKTTFMEAFKMADQVLHSGVRGITDLMVMPGLINLDFADIRAVMNEMGKAMMGTGEADGEGRAIKAAESAISNPLLDDVSMKGAKGVLINITGGFDMTLYEVDEAANRIREEVDEDANIIFGSTFDEALAGRMRVSVVATGIGGSSLSAQLNNHLAKMKESFYTSPLANDSFIPPEAEEVTFTHDEAFSKNSIENEKKASAKKESNFMASEVREEKEEHAHSQDTPPFSLRAQPSLEQEKGREKRPGFFERLWSSRPVQGEMSGSNEGEETVSLQKEKDSFATALDNDTTKENPSLPSNDDNDAEMLDIPAFLRRPNKS